ncbi:hypothetical protein [Paenibacillus albus]|uniref:Uncharacterized protein n=1 Tax=Paenibacillus albus TaxID=2495582 RepID=A0A3S9AC58_9BACL|nr:hypothetical protein [Paenibacillus albus]AZN43357.1 hypothetical protein EJC50_29450 [Paenibacillus albus]
MNYWPTAVKKLPSKVIRKFAGVNKGDPFAISEIFSSDTGNLTINDNGEVTTRPGYSVLGAAIGTRVLGLGVWKDMELHAVFGDGTWRRWTSSAWSTLASGLNTSAEWTFTNFKGDQTDVCLFGSNGIDTVRFYNGTMVSVLSGAPAGANYIAQFADRLWAAVGNELHASSYRKVGDWTTMVGDDADAWDVIPETPDGETINGIIADFTKLIVTKPSAMFKLMGYAPSDYSMQRVSLSTGQFNNKSSLVLEEWLYTIDDRGFYRYAGGSAPESDFSSRVVDYFNRITVAGKLLSALGTDGRRIYASLAIGGDEPDTVIVYDPKNDVFNEWNGLTALQFAQMGDDFYIGDANGRVLQLGGTTDNGAAIGWRWVSVPFTAQSMAQGIRITRMWVTVDLPEGSTLNAYLNPDASGIEGNVLVGTATGASSIQRKPIYLASNKVINTKQLRYRIAGNGPCILHEVAWDQIEMPIR